MVIINLSCLEYIDHFCVLIEKHGCHNKSFLKFPDRCKFAWPSELTISQIIPDNGLNSPLTAFWWPLASNLFFQEIVKSPYFTKHLYGEQLWITVSTTLGNLQFFLEHNLGVVKKHIFIIQWIELFLPHYHFWSKETHKWYNILCPHEPPSSFEG